MSPSDHRILKEIFILYPPRQPVFYILSTLVPASERVARGAWSRRRADLRAAADRGRRAVACVRVRLGAWASEGVFFPE
eukprot:6183194-Pleurochrysis_carterae.AAC.2